VAQAWAVHSQQVAVHVQAKQAWTGAHTHSCCWARDQPCMFGRARSRCGANRVCADQ